MKIVRVAATKVVPKIVTASRATAKVARVTIKVAVMKVVRKIVAASRVVRATVRVAATANNARAASL